MNRRAVFVFLLGIATLSIAACNPLGEQPNTEVITIPTAAEITMIVTIAPTATATKLAPSPMAPVALTTAAATATVTATRQPSVVPTLTNQPESTLAPVPTETPASSQLPVSPTPTPSGLSLIDFFQADVPVTDPGQHITLSWGTSSALTVTLWHLAATGQFSEFWTVPENGDFLYQVKLYERNRTTFALSAIDAEGNSEMATVEVSLRCPDEWFFANHPDICPSGQALASSAAEQEFEQGTMIWIGGEDRIYVLFGDGRQYAWQAYTDQWTDQEPDRNTELAPPEGFFQPIRGFGKIWREQPEVRDRLGWAIAEEVAFEGVLQRTSYAKYNETYLEAQDGSIWRLKAERSGWEKISGDLPE